MISKYYNHRFIYLMLVLIKLSVVRNKQVCNCDNGIVGCQDPRTGEWDQDQCPVCCGVGYLENTY